MLQYNDIKPRKYIVFDGEPYEVITSSVSRKQQNKPVNKTKLKSLLSERVIEHSFHMNDKVDEAEIDKKKAKYLYNNRGEVWFSDPNNPSDRFNLNEDVIKEVLPYMRPNEVFEIQSFEDRTIGVKLPIKVALKVTEAPPSIKGNTAQGGGKLVTTETGATVTVPMFISEGETIRINTETGEYVERVS